MLAVLPHFAPQFLSPLLLQRETKLITRKLAPEEARNKARAASFNGCTGDTPHAEWAAEATGLAPQDRADLGVGDTLMLPCGDSWILVSIHLV